MDLSAIRREYANAPFRKKDLSQSPFDQFERWMDEALKAEIIEPNAMALATVGEAGFPANRMVLLKKFDQMGLVFFTNGLSRKAKQMEAQAKAAGLFFWKELERQVCIEGSIEVVNREEVNTYFRARPVLSKIASWASKQDLVLSSREELEKEFAHFEEDFKNKEIPTPPYWEGYRLIPHRFEFWQGRQSRLHDRFLYVLKDSSWEISRLSP